MQVSIIGKKPLQNQFNDFVFHYTITRKQLQNCKSRFWHDWFSCILFTGKQIYTFRGKTILMRRGILDENNLERTLNGLLAVKPVSYAKERNKFLPLLLE